MKDTSATLTITVTDATGSQRSFMADRASLDCGSGSLEFQGGCPAYRRQFDEAVVKVFHSTGDAVLLLHQGTASVTASALHILCAAFREQDPG